MRLEHFAICLVGASLLACGGQGEFRKTGKTFAARGPSCEYRVIRNRTIEPYEVLGVIDIDAFSMRQLPKNEERFRNVVGPKVCGAGGDAIIPTLDIYGHWIHGTIIRFHPSECVECTGKNVEGCEG